MSSYGLVLFLREMEDPKTLNLILCKPATALLKVVFRLLLLL